MNQLQRENIWYKKMQHYQDEEGRSIKTIENQLVEFCQECQEKFTHIKNPCIASISRENLGNWSGITTLIVGDSMLSDIEERRISKWDRKVKVNYFPREKSDAMHNYINTSIHLKNLENTVRIYHSMTTNPENCHLSGNCDTGLSDFHRLTLIIPKVTHAKHKPKVTH